MTFRSVCFGVACLCLLSACENAGNDPLSQAARKQAIKTTEGIIEEEFPLFPADIAAPCIVDNASTKQLLVLASAAATKNLDAATDVVLELAEKKAFQTCLADGVKKLGEDKLKDVIGSDLLDKVF